MCVCVKYLIYVIISYAIYLSIYLYIYIYIYIYVLRSCIAMVSVRCSILTQNCHFTKLNPCCGSVQYFPFNL